jgi:hypothetical protein
MARPAGSRHRCLWASRDAGCDFVTGAVALFREDQERRSVFGRRCGLTLAGILRSERSSLLNADIAVVRKADAMREFSKI